MLSHPTGVSTIKGCKDPEKGVIPFGVSPAVVEFTDYTVSTPDPTLEQAPLNPHRATSTVTHSLTPHFIFRWAVSTLPT